MIGAILFSLALMGGCGSNPMVGIWNLRINDKAVALFGPKTNYFQVKMEFMGDGTYKVLYSKGSEVFTAEGNYRLAGKKLMLTATRDNGKDVRGATVTVALTDDMKSFDLPESGGVGRMFKE